MDATGLSLSSLTGFAQRVGQQLAVSQLMSDSMLCLVPTVLDVQRHVPVASVQPCNALCSLRPAHLAVSSRLCLPAVLCLQVFRVITAMDSDNYPECCHAIYIANAGATFSAIWKLLSAFVDKGTRDKVHVLGGVKASQAALLDAFGPELMPTFLGGQLDYEAVRQQWLDKMDAAIAQRQQQPRGKQPPLVLHAANGQPVQSQQQQQQLTQRSSSSGGLPPKLHLSHTHGTASSTSAAGERASSGDDGGWATPLSTASKFSTVSGTSVYFDPQDSTPVSPSGTSPASSDPGDFLNLSAPGAALGGSPLQHSSHAAQHTPEWGAGSMLSGSMSVGPHSRTRSQLSQQSGFTGITGPAGLGGHGAGSMDGGAGGLGLQEQGEAGSPNGQVPHDNGDGPAGDGKQPLCRCVIC
eukprot:GHRQ01018859.1.p1 GENE.GHRQ01018859.1~~GHRQ01018859.1.p1  ORF type:complete len:410 (+),score=121.45 GHRQ01018859.1:377-1606(+)